MPTKKPKSKVTKKSNVGLKASKFKPVKSGFRLSSLKRLNRSTLIAVVLVAVVVGGFFIYKSFAAPVPGSFNASTENGLVADINADRAAIGGLQNLGAAACLNTIARNWSQKMSDPSVGFKHNPNLVAQLQLPIGGGGCGGFTFEAENIFYQSGGCNTSASDPCRASAQRAFLNSPEHKANMEQCADRLVGVGVYVSSTGAEWVTEDFLSKAPWTLCGHASVVYNGTRAKTVYAPRGATVSFIQDVVSAGNTTATYFEHIDHYHYNSAWGLKGQSQINATTQNTAPFTSYTTTNNFVIPTGSTTAVGDKFCHQIYYSNATGPSTGGAVSNMACVIDTN